MKKTIVIFQGKFQYNVVNDFIMNLSDELTVLGYNVACISLKTKEGEEAFSNLDRSTILCCIGFNGIYSDLRLGNESFYDLFNIPYVYWLVDHPVHLIDRLIDPIKQKIVLCIDETHCDFVEKHFENAVVSFLPHSAHAVQPRIEKKYDVLFAGHLVSEQEMQMMVNEIDAIIKNLPHIINDNIWQQNNIVLQNLMDELYRVIPNAASLFNNNVRKESFLLAKVDRYVRAAKRYAIIKKLLENGITIDYFGHLPENHSFTNYDNFVAHGAVPYDELKQAMNEAKVVLNVFPNFPSGGHERIFEATAQNSLILSDRNAFIEQHLPHSLIYDIKNIEHVIPDLQKLLNDDLLLDERVAANQATFLTNHTWKQRAEQLKFIIEASIDYFNKS